jgi:hypothetical protein
MIKGVPKKFPAFCIWKSLLSFLIQHLKHTTHHPVTYLVGAMRGENSWINAAHGMPLYDD